jgi:hypothetical protein
MPMLRPKPSGKDGACGKGASLNEWDKTTFHGGGDTDYPTLEAADAAE